jgi:4-hydroxyacetophenone monooxygenase
VAGEDLAGDLDKAIADGHLPAMLVTLAHLTGDIGLLKDAWRPKYVPYADNRAGGLPSETVAELRGVLREVLEQAMRDGMHPTLPALSDDALQPLMDFVAGAAVPERYRPFLRDELGLDPTPVVTPSPALAALKVAIVGAGMSGILAAMTLKEAGIPFVLIERNADVGGTWFENNYPGCRVDSQNHIYCYKAVPNHDWPQHYSTQPALLAYFRDCVKRFELDGSLRLSTSVDEAVFDEKSGKWNVTLVDADGKRDTLIVDAVITAVGQLNKPRIPETPGRENFKGEEFHSARWRHDVDLRGKRVAVVGTGASAYQLAPAVAREAAHLDVFQRSAPWMAPTPDYHHDVGEGQKWLLRNLPGYANWYRFWMFWTITDGVYAAVKVDPDWDRSDNSISAPNRGIRDVLVGRMMAQIGERKDLVDKVIPKYPFGGKRTLRDSGDWIAMLKQDNVDLVTTPIKEMTPNAIITADGVSHPTDVIIYGTGFHATRFLEPMKIVGRGGKELTAEWSGDARAYLGMTVPGYPNFFCIYGPNTNLVVNGSIVFFSECSMHYILGCLSLLAQRKARTMEPKPEAFARYNDRVDAANAQMAWGMEGVSNWYKNAKGRVTQNWPFPLVDYWEATRAPNPDDFVFDGT